jgi:hypothetical protein
MNDSVEQLMQGNTWAQFCDALKSAGQQILRPEAPATPLDRAEGYRYLSRLVRVALEMHVEFDDPDFPGFIVPSHETIKIGADNPDNLYMSARLDGRHEYRVSGRRGTVATLNFATKKGGYANRDGRMDGTGFLAAKDMAFEADGSFELILSQQPKPGNWLPMAADSNQLLVRQTFLDRRTERPAQMRIERIGGKAKPRPLDPASLHDKLMRAGAFVGNTARLFADWAQTYQAAINTLPPADQAICQAAGGDPNIFYYHGYWQLADDEALLIEVARIPDCDFWNLQVDNYWMESLDYRYHRIHLNKHDAVLDAQGRVVIVVAEHDPRLPNWLETAGHRVGTLCFRWVGAREHVHPTTRVVKLADLRI